MEQKGITPSIFSRIVDALSGKSMLRFDYNSLLERYNLVKTELNQLKVLKEVNKEMLIKNNALDALLKNPLNRYILVKKDHNGNKIFIVSYDLNSYDGTFQFLSDNGDRIVLLNTMPGIGLEHFRTIHGLKDYDRQTTIRIADIVVNKERQGYGSFAIAFLEELAKDQGYKYIEGELSMVDETPEIFYKKQGYEISLCNPNSNTKGFIFKKL